MHRHIAFGLRWDSDIALTQFAEAPDDLPADIIVRRATGPLAERETLHAKQGASVCTDGFRIEGSDATIDFHMPGTVGWRPGRDWQGALPPHFYGTVPALISAWRGAVPIHGSSVEIDGRAYLICGESGAGKSTLAAALTASGEARLIGDDLSILYDRPEGLCLYPGRPAIRLFPSLAEHMRSVAEVCEDPGNDKLLVRPAQADPGIPIPLAATILLGAGIGAVPQWRRAERLSAQLFRPRWMRTIPGWEARFRILHRAAAVAPIVSLGAANIRNAEDFRARARAAVSLLQQAQIV